MPEPSPPTAPSADSPRVLKEQGGSSQTPGLLDAIPLTLHSNAREVKIHYCSQSHFHISWEQLKGNWRIGILMGVKGVRGRPNAMRGRHTVPDAQQESENDLSKWPLWSRNFKLNVANFKTANICSPFINLNFKMRSLLSFSFRGSQHPYKGTNVDLRCIP